MTTIGLSRRHLLSLSALCGTGMLAACTVAQGGGTTTVMIDIARIVTDGKAILSAVSAVLLIPAVGAALGANEAVAVAALAAAQAALNEIGTVTGGTVTLGVDITRVRALVVSLLGDIQTAVTLIQSLSATLPGNVAAQARSVVAISLSLIPLVQVAAGFSGARAVMAPMSEKQALAAAARIAS